MTKWTQRPMTEQDVTLQKSDADKKHMAAFMHGRARLDKLVPFVVGKLEDALKEKGIPAKVAGRVKNKHSLSGKLQKWAEDPKRASRLTSGASVFDIVGERFLTIQSSTPCASQKRPNL